MLKNRGERGVSGKMYQDERRMFDRFEVNFPAELKQPGEISSSSAQCCDVSATGVSVISKERLSPNAKLEISLGIPDGHSPFRGLGRVVWTNQVFPNKWRSGLEFETADFMGIRRIFDIVTK